MGMERSNIEKIAKTSEDRVLLARVWDKISAGMRKNIPANTAFLTLRELDMCRYLDMDFSSYFGDYLPPKSDFKGNSY